MGNEIVPVNGTLQKIGEFGIGNVIKPLMREIFLADVFVHGVLFEGGRLKTIKKGDELTLVRKNAPYDRNMVAVYRGEERFGELAEYDEGIFARLMDAGKKLTAKAKQVVILPDFAALEISISMMDF